MTFYQLQDGNRFFVVAAKKADGEVKQIIPCATREEAAQAIDSNRKIAKIFDIDLFLVTKETEEKLET